MKKLIVLVLSLFLVISSMGICAFAVDPEDIPESPAGWKAFGDIEVTYDSTLAEKIKFDGDLADWEGIQNHVIDINNLCPWQNTTVPDDFSINTYFAADAQYLYVAFWIMDSTPVAVPSSDTTYSYGGHDAFQISLDFSKAFAKNDEYYQRAIFYSFALREDKELVITADNREGDDGMTWTVPANETDENGKIPLKGAVGELEGGWQAEFAISWQMLYDDANEKLIDREMGAEGLTFELGPDTPLELGACICYLNYAPKADKPTEYELICAAGTSLYYSLGDNSLTDGFMPVNHGLHLSVKADEKINVDIETNNNQGGDDEETESQEAEKPTTEKATEATTEAKTAEETKSPASTEKTGDDDNQGCKSVAGIGAVAVVIAALGTGLVSFKKKR